MCVGQCLSAIREEEVLAQHVIFFICNSKNDVTSRRAVSLVSLLHI
jgi:hypothetical protein